ncbi:cell division protein SepF [Cetobacterium sp. SF1]|uniref:cell division protein SepF n=1 Tax=unclassified Cetobacterium TaxID=2630983 RepID=UPI003CF30127
MMGGKGEGLKSKLKSFKEMIGIDTEEEDSMNLSSIQDIEIEEEKIQESPSPRIEQPNNSQEESKGQYQTVFVDPRSFSDCKKIANYIKNDKMVTLNLEYLDNKEAQRMMDFLSGAMSIKEAKFVEISKKVYTSIPKAMKFHYEGRNELKQRSFLNIGKE